MSLVFLFSLLPLASDTRGNVTSDFRSHVWEIHHSFESVIHGVYPHVAPDTVSMSHDGLPPRLGQAWNNYCWVCVVGRKSPTQYII